MTVPHFFHFQSYFSPSLNQTEHPVQISILAAYNWNSIEKQSSVTYVFTLPAFMCVASIRAEIRNDTNNTNSEKKAEQQICWSRIDAAVREAF